MTGIAELYLCIRRPHSKDARARLKAIFQTQKYDQTRFVVLSWKRTGSNLLCGILHFHPEITMHNELYNQIDIFTYHPDAIIRNEEGDRWTVLGRDLWPEAFLDHIWSGKSAADGAKIKEDSKAVGFKSFPEHWTDVQNEPVWQERILEDIRIKKIVLHREDELAVYVSMKRAELTGRYMTIPYPKNLKIHIDPALFQAFVNNYRDTFQRKYKSPMERRDTFRLTYEQMIDEDHFEQEILPLLWDFLSVDKEHPAKKLRETIKQANPSENLSDVIDNYDELEFSFRHTDVLHFSRRRQERVNQTHAVAALRDQSFKVDEAGCVASWSLLLPICSRVGISKATGQSIAQATDKFNSNRFIELTAKSQYNSADEVDHGSCWALLHSFVESLARTADAVQLSHTECVVGIDIDDPVFANGKAREKIQSIVPCKVVFVDVRPENYGRVCKIWNHLARQAHNDFIVLLGDDVVLLDEGWQRRVVRKFHELERATGMPFGAACVALRDMSFQGFPTFPVVHRWHLRKFGDLLPRQFVNQGGDPYLYELYSRFDAAAFEVTCRLKNTIGGDGNARYKKHEINWRGHTLKLNTIRLESHLGGVKPTGVTLDVVVPSYRTSNADYLRTIASLRASVPAYVRFWLVVDNPRESHLSDVQDLAKVLNEKQLEQDGNYFIYVVSYGENRGASYARNTGYNYSTADWVLFVDDDVIPDADILDAYIGAIKRYPDAKVFVGLTELPPSCNLWTEMLRTCNIMFFYGVAKHMTHPPWGVTANLMVRGSRHNPTIQFKHIYPKTGGGEDIDFVLQFKQWYRTNGLKTVVGVPGAKAKHPWWRNASPCYGQINGWAWGDSRCITEWKQKTFLVFPNWIECIVFGAFPFAIYTGRLLAGLRVITAIAGLEHAFLTARYYPRACQVCKNESVWRRIWVAFGAGTVLSSQEIVRIRALMYRVSFFSLCRRVDWNDGQQPKFKLDMQFGSFLRFGGFAAASWLCATDSFGRLFRK